MLCKTCQPKHNRQLNAKKCQHEKIKMSFQGKKNPSLKCFPFPTATRERLRCSHIFMCVVNFLPCWKTASLKFNFFFIHFNFFSVFLKGVLICPFFYKEKCDVQHFQVMFAQVGERNWRHASLGSSENCNVRTRFLQQEKQGHLGGLWTSERQSLRDVFVLRQRTHPGVYVYPNGIKFHTKSN